MDTTTRGEQVESIKHPGKNWDLVLIFIFGIGLGILVGLANIFPTSSNSPVGWMILIGRIILGLPFVLYIPGNLLQGLFFPHKADLYSIERIGLSLGLSVTLITILALLLNALTWGLSTKAILVGQGILVLVLIVATLIMRMLVPGEGMYIPDVNPHLGRWWSRLGQSERRIMLVMAGALILALITAAWIFLVPSPSDYMTELYMLGPEGVAENFPREASVGQSLDITIGVTNHERTDQVYRLEVWQVDNEDDARRKLVGSSDSFDLTVGENFQFEQTWVPAWAGKDQQFEFLLFTGANSTPYRQLLLWMNINDQPAP